MFLYSKIVQMVYKNSKNGAQGIGTLIIFIALILVAAVAAGVLVSTVGKLQGKAENTGTEIQQRLGTGFEVVEVVSNDTSDGQIDAGTDTILVTARLSPGSDPIKFGDITITQVTNNGLQSYTNGSTATSTTFNTSVVTGVSSDGYLDKVDVITFRILSNQTIVENEEFTIRLFPGSGNPLPIKLVTPPSMTKTFTVLK